MFTPFKLIFKWNVLHPVSLFSCTNSCRLTKFTVAAYDLHKNNWKGSVLIVLSYFSVPETLNATTESTLKQKYEPIQENGIASKPQTYILYGVVFILLLAFCLIPSYWFYRNAPRRRMKRLVIVVFTSAFHEKLKILTSVMTRETLLKISEFEYVAAWS